MIRVDRNVRIGEKDFETHTALAHIVQGLDKEARGREALTRELLIDPFEEDFNQRFAVSQAMQLFGFTDEFVVEKLDPIVRIPTRERRTPRGYRLLASNCSRLTLMVAHDGAPSDNYVAQRVGMLCNLSDPKGK
jgi:hypothetical protein